MPVILPSHLQASHPRRLLLWSAVGVAVGAAIPWARESAAQQRIFPAGHRVGWIGIGVFPQGTLDGEPILLAPGTRIVSETGALVLPAMFGEPRRVVYARDPLGQVNRIWIVTPDELARVLDELAARGEAPADSNVVSGTPGTGEPGTGEPVGGPGLSAGPRPGGGSVRGAAN